MNVRQKTLRFTHVQRCKNTISGLLRKRFDLLNVIGLSRVFPSLEGGGKQHLITDPYLSPPTGGG
jgi:hypothetical protein